MNRPAKKAAPHEQANRCSHIFVQCMDFRTQATIDALIESLGIRGSHILGMRGSFDRISVQGGAANFEQLQVHLATAKRLHDCHTAILTVHENCGAGAKREDLLTARRMAQELGYRCRLFFVKLNGQWDEVL